MATTRATVVEQLGESRFAAVYEEGRDAPHETVAELLDPE